MISSAVVFHHAVVGEDVGEDVVEVLDAVGLADLEGVEGDAHHPAVGLAFGVEAVELPLAHAGELVGFPRRPGVEVGRVVELDGVGHRDQLSGLHLQGERLVIVEPVGVVGEAGLGHEVGGAVGGG